MSKRLLIIRDPGSRLLDYLNLDRDDQEIVLIQNAVYSERLRQKNASLLEEDVKARNIDTDGKTVDYDKLVDAIFSAQRVICV